jgi:hypothetical protein
VLYIHVTGENIWCAQTCFLADRSAIVYEIANQIEVCNHSLGIIIH